MMESSAAGGSASGSDPAVGTAGAGGEPPAKKPRLERQQWKFDAEEQKWDTTNWQQHHRMTKFANELKNIEPLKVGDTCLKPDGEPLSNDELKLVEEVGMEIYPMTTSLHKTEGKNTWLFVRKHAKEVWSEVLRREYEKSAVIGSPGIGKSVSSLYFLKKLLEKNTVVIYEARRDNMVYAFIPPGKDDGSTEYVVYSARLADWGPEVCPALAVPENYYLIDPGKVEKIVPVLAHTVIFPSPENKHFDQWSKASAAQSMERFYIGTWTKQEVLAVRHYIRVKGNILDPEVVEKSFYRFGGILRHIFTTEQEQAVCRQKADDALKRKEVVKAVYSGGAQAFCAVDREKPASALFTLVPVEDLDSSHPYVQERPGSFRLFSDAHVAIVSDWARRALVRRYWDDIESLVRLRDFRTATEVGWLFEDAAHFTLARGGEFTRRYFDEGRPLDKLVLAAREVQVVAGSFDACLLAIKDTKNEGFYMRPLNPKMPLLDAAEGGTTELYQMTIDMEHELAASYLEKAVKVLLPKGKGKHKGKHKGKLVINWVVPKNMSNKLKLKVVKGDLKHRVEQRIICCNPVLPPDEPDE